MDETLIANWNLVVTPDDTVWHVGDFTLSNRRDIINGLAARLNGHKNLVMGNHDRQRPNVYLEAGFETVIGPRKSYRVQGLNLITGGRQVVLMHHPPELESNGDIILHGHVHDKSGPPRRNIYNISVEVTDYRPVTLPQILGRQYGTNG